MCLKTYDQGHREELYKGEVHDQWKCKLKLENFEKFQPYVLKMLKIFKH